MRWEERVKRSEDHFCVLRIIALISFKIFLTEGIFDGLISTIVIWPFK